VLLCLQVASYNIFEFCKAQSKNDKDLKSRMFTFILENQDMDYIEIVGLGAALFTTVSNIPQALKIIRTKETKGVSTKTYSILFTGLVLWVVYGFLRNDFPLILANGISALICGIVLFLKLTSRKILNDIHDKVHEK
jgi:MtN3 and saliva related transmembrane protein